MPKKAELAVPADPDAELFYMIRRYRLAKDNGHLNKNSSAVSMIADAFLDLLDNPLQAQERIECLLLKLVKEKE